MLVVLNIFAFHFVFFSFFFSKCKSEVKLHILFECMLKKRGVKDIVITL